MAISTTIEYASIDELMLDPMNPRLGRRNATNSLSQSEIIDIIRTWHPEELAVSFLESGFWPQEALVTVIGPDIDAGRRASRGRC